MKRPPSRPPGRLRPSPSHRVHADALPPVFRIRCKDGECVEDPPVNSAARRVRLADKVCAAMRRLGAAAVSQSAWQSDAVDDDGVTWLVTAAPTGRGIAQVTLLPVSVDADPAPVDQVAGMTPREREVLLLSLRGHSPREIAARLDISWHTVRTHLKRAYRALGVSGRGEAIALVLEATCPRVHLRLIAGEPEGAGHNGHNGSRRR